MGQEGAAAPTNGGFFSLAQTARSSPSWVRADPVIQTDLLDDLAVLEFEDGDAGEVHLPARVGGQATSKKVSEGRTSMSAAALQG